MTRAQLERSGCKVRPGLLQCATLNPGQRIGPFEIVTLLGRGGMGEVFLATDTRLDRKVAIKVLTVDYADGTDHVRRFEQEAKSIHGCFG